MGIIDFLVIIPSLKINIDIIMIYEINYLNYLLSSDKINSKVSESVNFSFLSKLVF